MKPISKVYTAIIMIFLFAPIAILLVFSFNEAKSLSVFSGFSLNWYRELFKDAETLGAVRNTLVLAASAAVISTIMGTAAAVGINKLRSRVLRTAMDTVTNVPMVNPDIITGISLMLMFVFVGRLFGAATSLNFVTMLIAHVTFCLPYVILQVLPKLQQMDRSLPEAAMDLGCTPFRAFMKAEIPEIMPGVVTGLIMAFTLSLDDFVISYFTSGNGFQTLPIRIYNMTKKTVTPKMYALATIIFFVILALLIMTNLIDTDKPKAAKTAKAARAKRSYSRRSRIAAAVIGAVLLIGMICVIVISGGNTLTLNVYNWGEYISDGSDDTLDTVKAFEEYYYETYGVKVKVNYTTYASNEDMFAKLSSGAVSFDVVIPSDYMIARMRENDMLLPLDYSNIPNYQYIDESFRSLYYDPDNMYTVPYTYGVVGIIYNANKVDEADAHGWELMWNEKYAGDILQFNNSRDAFATAQYMLGLDVNSTDRSNWDRALEELKDQSPLVKSYVMDEVYNMMESGEASIAPYYAGDYFTMIDAQADDVDLRFYYPDPTNYFVDAMCIPSCCQNKELAEIFINYMLSPEPAIANAEFIYYASPNSLVYEDEGYIEDLGEEAMAILYPEMGDFRELYNAYAYRSLDAATLDYVNSLWETLKIN
ncbi:MAG: extracellular solute-binding protein [Candidatus Limivicinus sp.]|nr:extracellular solute-binding protein [Clostridiales bacterium]MDY3859565.1 extracellular solute-binding protein [Candidatus Limivicinus sp.]